MIWDEFALSPHSNAFALFVNSVWGKLISWNQLLWLLLPAEKGGVAFERDNNMHLVGVPCLLTLSVKPGYGCRGLFHFAPEGKAWDLSCHVWFSGGSVQRRIRNAFLVPFDWGLGGTNNVSPFGCLSLGEWHGPGRDFQYIDCLDLWTGSASRKRQLPILCLSFVRWWLLGAHCLCHRTRCWTELDLLMWVSAP